MSEQLTKRQHYVWRRYLRPWKQNPNDKGLWTCLLEHKKIAVIGEVDVAQASYFYKIEELNTKQLEFLSKYVSMQPPTIKKYGFDLLNQYKVYADLMAKMRAGDSTLTSIPDIDHKLKEIEINTFEHLNGKIEIQGSSLIDCRSISDIKSMSKSVLDESMHYLWVQYMRTRGMKESFVSSMADRPEMQEIGDKTWPFMLFLNTANLWLTGIKKDDARYTIIINNSNIPFIVGDQPVINIRDNKVDNNGYVTECELYYPLSPDRALLVSFDKGPKYSEVRKGCLWVKTVNRKIWDHSTLHVFGSNEKVLKDMLQKKDFIFNLIYKYFLR